MATPFLLDFPPQKNFMRMEKPDDANFFSVSPGCFNWKASFFPYVFLTRWNVAGVRASDLEQTEKNPLALLVELGPGSHPVKTNGTDTKMVG